MIRYSLRHSEELHIIIVENIIEEKRTTKSPRNSYVEKIKHSVIVKTLRTYKKKRTIKQIGELQLQVSLQVKKNLFTVLILWGISNIIFCTNNIHSMCIDVFETYVDRYY